MHLRYITCSGTNESTDIKGLINLMKKYQYFAEIGVQVSDKQSPKGGERLEWIHDLVHELKAADRTINAALHVNQGWVEQMCRGIVVPELEELIGLKSVDGQPFFKRIQLNFKLGRDDVSPNCADTLVTLQRHLNRQFILSFNESNERLVRELYLKGLRFDCLYDSSFGKGILPDFRKKPAFTHIVQGYAGGIDPQNVTSELDKIARAIKNSPSCGVFYIDAEKGLQGNDGHLSLEKCETYLMQARQWYLSHGDADVLF